MRKETRARMLSVQALYQLDIRGETFFDEMDDFIKSTAGDESAVDLALKLAHGCVERRDELDARLASAAEHWELARMAAVDRAILRVGAYELLHCADLPPKVAISEAIRMAKKLSSAESGAFVNGILDRIMPRCDREATMEDGKEN